MPICQLSSSVTSLISHKVKLRRFAANAFVPSKRLLSTLFLSAAISVLNGGFSPMQAASSSGAFLVPQRAISQPPGSLGLCSKYRWACARTGRLNFNDSAALRLAKAVNLKVNRQTRQIEDRVQYGRDENWTLPTARGGDCEDLVLLKKKILVESGMASERLLIATVLDRKMNSHAVLVFRTKRGDLVLDSLTNTIVSWKKTGYTFLKMQNPASLGNWEAVLAGGVIKDRPTASQ